MNLKKLLGYLAAVIVPQVSTNQKIPIEALLILITGCISIIVAKVFLGLSLYKALCLIYTQSEAMLATAAVFLMMAILLIMIAKYYLKKAASKSIIMKEYSLVKNVLSALIAGYNSK
ncbi:hypothetical protein [Rickettsiales endosymbiont of Stachyamoeba lipophora]|uniref:hypothetical protein n=1 Tax=Rickettsiales endosymbiont of Stachyamoeba lipophora TaxID=2486578 RepID=UPI000F6524B8|nr:hypothetical protein [Rickettsiales endosymbiont of Stachyamoeba lipophora]AZL15053.1 hypothetical protein EF513_00530 [Rickettsiales endosymbiont of Stachyamoeba lipophora]